jgi:hypothetical protein
VHQSPATVVALATAPDDDAVARAANRYAQLSCAQLPTLVRDDVDSDRRVDDAGDDNDDNDDDDNNDNGGGGGVYNGPSDSTNYGIDVEDIVGLDVAPSAPPS